LRRGSTRGTAARLKELRAFARVAFPRAEKLRLWGQAQQLRELLAQQQPALRPEPA